MKKIYCFRSRFNSFMFISRTFSDKKYYFCEESAFEFSIFTTYLFAFFHGQCFLYSYSSRIPVSVFMLTIILPRKKKKKRVERKKMASDSFMLVSWTFSDEKVIIISTRKILLNFQFSPIWKFAPIAFTLTPCILVFSHRMEKYIAVILCEEKVQLVIPCGWYGNLDCNDYNRGIYKCVKRRVFYSPFGSSPISSCLYCGDSTPMLMRVLTCISFGHVTQKRNALSTWKNAEHCIRPCTTTNACVRIFRTHAQMPNWYKTFSQPW